MEQTELELKEMRYMILKIIACGKPFNGWVCGDFLEEDRGDDGESYGQCYFCDECNNEADKIIEIVKCQRK